jgi:hypothetical protein
LPAGTYRIVLKDSGNLTLDTQIMALVGPFVEADTSPIALEPFDSVTVYHKFYGQSVATWRLNASFGIATPHIYQLETSLAGHVNAGDWVPVTPLTANTDELWFYQAREQKGKLLTTYARVVLFAGGRKFVSQPTPIGYALDAKQQAYADEVIRKEKLRMQVAGSQRGYLLKAYRYGKVAAKARDPGTQEVIDELNEYAYARPFENGYYPPVAMTLDTTIVDGVETVGDGNPNTNNSATPGLAVRALAYPPVQHEDIWVDAVSDRRYRVEEPKTVVSIAGQPLVVQLMLRLLPFSHVVYKIPVDRLSFRRFFADQPAIGNGCVPVNHDYPTIDNLSYRLSDCCGVAGASVKIFPATSLVNGDFSNAALIAETITTAAGHWQHVINMNPGTYVLVFEKPGVAGPDFVDLTIPEPESGLSIPAEPADNFLSVVDL